MSRVAALVLAAGASRRMGGPNKLLAELDGVSLVRRVVDAALASRAAPVLVVTGHQDESVAASLAGRDVALRYNPAYSDGLSTSLAAGIAALPDDAEAVLVLLADMPFVTAAMLDRLIGAFEAGRPPPIVVPTHGGRRGNPVLWPRRCFADLAAVEGDKGGRELIARQGDAVVAVEIGAAASTDIDTPEALAEAGGRLSP